jgi:hypothetical protein
MPHPHAVLKHGDKGEVSRKASILIKNLTLMLRKIEIGLYNKEDIASKYVQIFVCVIH